MTTPATEKCKKCRGSGELRKGEKCRTCAGSGKIAVSKGEDGRIVIAPAVRP